MPIDVMNLAFTKVYLDQQHPNADPGQILQFSAIAGLLPGTSGLIVPLIADDQIVDRPSVGQSDGGPPRDGGEPPAGANGLVERQLNSIRDETHSLEQSLNDRIDRLQEDIAAALKALQSSQETAATAKPGAKSS